MEITNQTSSAIVEIGLNPSQVAIVSQTTPRELIKKRKGRSGKTYDYLPHVHVARKLNEAFNHQWNFETKPIFQFCNDKELTVKGRLTIYCPNGQTIIKEQFGQQDLLNQMPLGDALKGAASDALKKCASLLGIALDLYGDKELQDLNHEPKQKPKPNQQPNQNGKMSEAQKSLILTLLKSHIFSEEEKEKGTAFANNGANKQKAAEFIDRLQALMKERKHAEKLAEEQNIINLFERKGYQILDSAKYSDDPRVRRQEEEIGENFLTLSKILSRFDFNGKMQDFLTHVQNVSKLAMDSEEFAEELIKHFGEYTEAWGKVFPKK